MTPRGVFISAFGRTDTGRVRKHNEDAFVVADSTSTHRVHSMTEPLRLDVGDRGVLFAVSDGMGGAQAGEVASTIALQSLRRGMVNGTANGEAALEASVLSANERVWTEACESGRKGMGATLTAVLVQNGYAYIAEIGDSRAYLLRGEGFVQVTHDQSYVQLLVDRGALTPEQAGHSQFKNVILQAVGVKPEVTVAINRVPLRRGDRFLLCSDGLSNKVGDDDMHAVLKGASLESACSALVDMANERGGEDNITAVIVEIDGDGAPLSDVGDRISVETLQAFTG